MPDEREPKQPTQPRGKNEDGSPAKPIEIPVPKRGEIDKLLKKASKPTQRPPR